MFLLGGPAVLGGTLLESLDEIVIDVSRDQLRHDSSERGSTAINANFYGPVFADGLLHIEVTSELLFGELATELRMLGATADVVMVGGSWMLWQAQRSSTRDVDSDRSFEPTSGSTRSRHSSMCMYDTYVPNKTISVPDDVVPIIDNLGVPFSTWVADQLRHHAATHSGVSLSQQLLADAKLAGIKAPTKAESLKAMERMERSAPW